MKIIRDWLPTKSPIKLKDSFNHMQLGTRFEKRYIELGFKYIWIYAWILNNSYHQSNMR